MIELLIFHLHIAAALYAFTKNWQSSGVKEGLLGVIIIGLVFAIGWALTGTLAYQIMPNSTQGGFFNSDTLSLVMLVIPESIFFYLFFVKSN